MQVKDGGCEHFIVHARKAILGGLTPKQNREIPPLKYDVVYSLRKEFPGIHFSINGGVLTLDQATGHLDKVDPSRYNFCLSVLCSNYQCKQAIPGRDAQNDTDP